MSTNPCWNWLLEDWDIKGVLSGVGISDSLTCFESCFDCWHFSSYNCRKRLELWFILFICVLLGVGFVSCSDMLLKIYLGG